MVKAKTRQSTVTAAPPIPIRGIAVVVSPNRNGLLLGYISNSILTPMVPRASPSAPLMNERTMLSVSNWRRMRLRPAPSAVLIAISRVLRSARTSRRFATLTQAMSNRRPTAARRRFSDDRTLPTIASWSGSTLHTVRALTLPGASRRDAAAATASWARQRQCPDRVERQARSEEHTSELQSLTNLVCRLLLEKKKKNKTKEKTKTN